jgi:hypothetical protein
VKHPDARKCERCHNPRYLHLDGDRCPKTKTFFHQRRHPRPPHAVNSFAAVQVNILDTVFSVLQRGGKAADLTVVVRHPEFSKLAAKVRRMKQKVEKMSAEEVLKNLAQAQGEG